MGSEDQFDPYGLPIEIYSPILPLIGMTGLDISHKKSHQAVWEAFTLNRRSDRISLKFILLPEKPEFPLMKQKRQSYEWYIPKGILKSNWINKYLNHIPSLLVLFWDLDWTDSQWIDEKNKIAATIQSLKLSLGGRNTRIAVVLIQSASGSPPVPGEDGNGASEKAASLCAACDLPPKHLFVLPHTDTHLLGYTMRLENAFSEIAGGFYLGEIKGIKAHRDYLNKTNHQLLFIRHQFKIAFQNEMRTDPQTAIKHYGQCYNHLLEHRFTNTNLHEIRTVAAIVNYKICKLDFVLNLPRDAIEQFRRHIEVFRQRTGPKELIFEHYAWLSKQYQIFGEIFEEAVREGLPAVQTQHPGFYYKQAAHYAVLRRNTALQVCKDTSPPEENLLKGWKNLEFYGQRPWRPGKHSLEPPEMHTETEGIKAFCYYEMNTVDHSSLIIPLFSSAITQFKNYRCPRIKRYLMVQMAKEYHHAQDPSKALTLLSHVMWDDRNERWWPLLSSCSPIALSCAYQMASVQEYLALCLEILGPRITATTEEKADALSNLMKISNLEIPSPPPGLSEDAQVMASEMWSINLHSTRQNVVVNMNDILPCLEVKAGFASTTAAVDLPAQGTVNIRNHLSQPLQLFYLIIYTDSTTCAQLKETDRTKLHLPASDVSNIPFVYAPSVQDVDKVIRITAITAGLGTSPEKTLTLHWTGNGREGVTIHTGSTTTHKEFGYLPPNSFEGTEMHSEITVKRRSPKLDVNIKYDENALVWEWLPVSFEILNKESTTISDLFLTLSLEYNLESNLERTTQISSPASLESKLISSSVTEHPLPPMMPEESSQCIFFIKSLTAAKRSFRLKISYNCEIEMEKKNVICPSVFVKSFAVTSKIPFQITIETQSLQFLPLSKVAKNERFLIVPKIKCCSHVPITFTNSSIGLASVAKSEGENQSQVSDVEVEEAEEATDCFCVSVGSEAPFSTPISLGQYLLYWKRSGENSPTVSVSIGLPSITLEEWGIWVDADLPPQGIVRVPLTVAYEITNTCDRVQSLAVSMHVSDAFMFSGHKELNCCNLHYETSLGQNQDDPQKSVRLRILPGWQECITYTMYPLLAGFVQLPRLHIAMETPTTASGSGSLDDFIDRILPTHLFIMPQEKPLKDQNPHALTGSAKVSACG